MTSISKTPFPRILRNLAVDAIHYSDAETLQRVVGIIEAKNKHKDRKYEVNTIHDLYNSLDSTYYSQHKDDLEKLLNQITWKI